MSGSPGTATTVRPTGSESDLGERSAAQQRTRTPYEWPARAFSLPAVLLVALLLYLPFVWTTYISFTDYNGLGSPVWVGLSNYRDMVSDSVFLTAVGNTLLWVVGSISLPVALGLLIAVLTYGRRFGTLIRLPFLIPYAVSGVAVGVIWGFVLQTQGALGQVLEFLNLPGASTRWLLEGPLNTFVMIGAASWQIVGVNALLFVIGLQSIPREPVEAARLDGATGWTMFRCIVWPQMRALTTVVIGLSIVASLKTFDIVWIMTQGGPGRVSETLALTMYRETFVLSDYGQGAAIAVFLSVVTFAASIIYLRRQLSDRATS